MYYIRDCSPTAQCVFVRSLHAATRISHLIVDRVSTAIQTIGKPLRHVLPGFSQRDKYHQRWISLNVGYDYDV